MSIHPTTPTAQADDHEQGVPENVLTWRSPKQRSHVLSKWRRAVFSAHPKNARLTRVACVLKELFHVTKFYAFPGNGYLSTETAMSERKVQEALAALEKGGAIARATISAWR